MVEFIKLKHHKCPECGNNSWHEGPSGGAAVNICCDQGHWYNDCGAFGLHKIDDKDYVPDRPWVIRS